jgi:putative molybdopterin biosynthesis protein
MNRGKLANPGNRVRLERERRGWSQQDLAHRAGITRQVVVTVETERHNPSVSVAIALANVLGMSVEELFRGSRVSSPVRLTEAEADGTPIAMGLIGSESVATRLPSGSGTFDGWGLADGVVVAGAASWFDDALPARMVIAGCDPLLTVLAGLAERRSGERIVCTHATTQQAIASLSASRCHAALVHGSTLPVPKTSVMRWKVAQWQVGLAASGPRVPSLEALSERNETVVQRAAGAGSQQSLDRALHSIGAAALKGPIAATHLDVARRVSLGGRKFGAGLTMEAAARAYELSFAPLESHQVELWIDRRWLDEPTTIALLDVLNSASLSQRAGLIGGYDMTSSGSAVA